MSDAQKYRVTPTDVLHQIGKGEDYYEKVHELVYYVNRQLDMKLLRRQAPPGVIEFHVDFPPDGQFSAWILYDRRVQYDLLSRYKEWGWVVELRETAAGGLLLCLRAP